MTAITVDYDLQEWPKLRNLLELFLKGQRKHTVYGHGEMDVTLVLEKIEALKKSGNPYPSLNTFLIYTLSRVAAKHEQTRTCKFKNRKLVFKHADISLPILKTLPNGVKIPVLYVVRKAETKSLAQINFELKNAIKSDLTEDKNVKFRRKLAKLPLFVQKIMYWYIFKHPVRIKKFFGNMGLTNLQHMGYDSPMIGLPPSIYSLQFAAGSVSEKFLPDADKKPVLRKVLAMAGGMDHLVMDGMCIAAISKDFSQSVEKADGIDDDFVKESRELERNS